MADTPDDITRLAGRVLRLKLDSSSDREFEMMRDEKRQIAAELRTLAQGTKTGGVLGWVRPTDAAKIKDLRSGALGLYTSAQQDDIYTMPIYAAPPANPPEPVTAKPAERDAVADNEAAWVLIDLAMECGAEDCSTDDQPRTWALTVESFTRMAVRLQQLAEENERA